MNLVKWRGYVRILSFYKLFNLFKSACGYFISFIIKKDIVLGYPHAVSIEPTNYCNLHCPECPSGMRKLSRERGNVDLKMVNDFLDQTGKYLIHTFLYFQGEPMMHPQFDELIRLVKKHKIYVATSTNGHFLTSEKCKQLIESGIDELIISVDGASQEIYETYRVGGQLDKVVSGIKLLADLKKQNNSQTPFINIQFLLTSKNEHQLKEMQHLCYRWGADKLSVKTVQLYDYKNGHELMPGIAKYSRYQRDNDGTFKIKSSLSNRCKRLWYNTVLCWDGNVVACCFDKDGDFLLGNIKEQRFFQIWKSERASVIRRKILKNRKGIEMCCNCTEGLRL